MVSRYCFTGRFVEKDCLVVERDVLRIDLHQMIE